MGLHDVLAPASLGMLLEIRCGGAIRSFGTIEVGLKPLDALETCAVRRIISGKSTELENQHVPERFLHPSGAAQVNCWKLRPLVSFLVTTSDLKN